MKTLVALMLIVVCCSQTLLADQKPPKYPVETKSFELTITDGEKPVKGAKVKLYACRCIEDPGSHYGWPSANTDCETEFVSDENGKVSLLYPVKFGEPSNWKTIFEVSLIIAHTNYVHDELHIDPRVGKSDKVIKAGCELTFSALDSNRAPVDIGAVMAGPGRAVNWLRDDKKVIRSQAIPDGRWQTLLVSPREDGRHLFSGVLSVRLADQQNVKIRNLRLKPGLHISGSVSENVSLPVKDGIVLAHCLPKPAGRKWGNDDPTVTWSATTKIRPDGTFDFRSLPATGRIQFIALAEGWLTSNSDGRHNFHRGQIFQVDDLNIADGYCDDFVLEMKPTGSLVVTVHDADGKPLPGARVGTNPNQAMELGGSNILGTFSDTIDYVKASIDGTDAEPYKRISSKAAVYLGKTNEKGQFTIKGIPLGVNYQVGAYHDDFVMPFERPGRPKKSPFKCESTEPEEVTIKLKRRETNAEKE